MNLIGVRCATITDKGKIALPKELRKRKRFKVGSKIAVLAYDDHIELRPMQDVQERLATAYASEHVLAKDWNTPEEDKTWQEL